MRFAGFGSDFGALKLGLYWVWCCAIVGSDRENLSRTGCAPTKEPVLWGRFGRDGFALGDDGLEQGHRGWSRFHKNLQADGEVEHDLVLAVVLVPLVVVDGLY
jgi:hypothetical protein